ncbi:MAPEG family protein [Pseudoruegeria sp. HB172150]|uniref:MAPEG family protein n=1 Tax=Pseudoruegeria sp. HB172150 TaxID=2721164 RepID=UPI001556AEE6|nr:MAPEG family protein [Pseudoruegeria sp. HB172150]
MIPTITPIYAGLIALLFLFLSLRVVAGRFRHRISVGDGGEKDMVKRMRTQANCAEYAPVGLLLLLMAELQGMAPWALHVLGGLLLAGRVLHAYGYGRTPQIVLLRRVGMFGTVASISITAVAVMWMALV